jgi:ribose transport system substrate-binding protein
VLPPFSNIRSGKVSRLALATSLFAIFIVALVISGCGASSGSSSSSSTPAEAGSGAGGGEAEPTADVEGAGEIEETPGVCEHGETGISALPKEQQEWYANVDKTVQACVSPYVKWTKPIGKPPWTIAYAGTYSGNAWRQVSLKRIEELAKEYEEAGLVKKLIVSDSGGDSTRMIQQLNQAVEQGAEAILTTSPPESAINGSLKEIYEKEIPFVSIDGDTTSPYYLATGGNLREAGKEIAEQLVSEIGGKGTIVAINGIPGITPSEATWLGAKAVFDQYPEIKLMGGKPIYGQYTESVAKTEMLKLLSSHPEELAGVFVQGSMEMAAIEALEQTGRPAVPVTNGGATNAGVFWQENPETWEKGFVYYPTIADTDIAWEAMMRTLEGQGPKVTSMTRPPVAFGFEDLKEMIPPGATLSSGEEMDPPKGTWWTTEQVDAFFEKPADPLAFKE